MKVGWHPLGGSIANVSTIQKTNQLQNHQDRSEEQIQLPNHTSLALDKVLVNLRNSILGKHNFVLSILYFVPRGHGWRMRFKGAEIQTVEETLSQYCEGRNQTTICGKKTAVGEHFSCI